MYRISVFARAHVDSLNFGHRWCEAFLLHGKHCDNVLHMIAWDIGTVVRSMAFRTNRFSSTLRSVHRMANHFRMSASEKDKYT